MAAHTALNHKMGLFLAEFSDYSSGPFVALDGILRHKLQICATFSAQPIPNHMLELVWLGYSPSSDIVQEWRFDSEHALQQ
jgi:hypothetical protein